MKKGPLDKWLYLLIIVMGIYFLMRIIDQAKMVYTFPLVNNDLGSYVAQLHLLKVCGFHNLCLYWYNGFVTFLISSPGWEFFAYPLYAIFDHIMLATYLSSIVMYIIGFVFVYYLGKSLDFSWTKIISLFIIIFANSINIGNFIIMGRMPSLNATVFFTGLAAVIYFYKEKKINKRFVLLFVPLNILVILSHYQEAALAQILILSLLLIKKGYEKLIVVFSFILSLLFSAFWWVPFLISSTNLEQSSLTTYEQGKWFISNVIPKIEFTTQFFTSLLMLLIPLSLFFVFYFYWNSKKRPKKELLFYLPVLILSLIFWLRLTAYLPVLKFISPDPFLILFLFFIAILFFRTEFYYYPKILRYLIILFLISFPLANVFISHIKTPYWDIFEYGDIEKETLSLFEFIDPNEKFVFVSPPLSSQSKSFAAYYYAYATVYNNLSTPSGFYYFIASQNYMDGIIALMEESDCEKLEAALYGYNTSYVIGYDGRCDYLKNCKFKEVITKKRTCLYRL